MVRFSAASLPKGKLCLKRIFILQIPIYYPSGKLHICSATTIVCDVLARYKRLMGYDVFLSDCLDEHGQKIQQKRKKLVIQPQAYVDGMAVELKNSEIA